MRFHHCNPRKLKYTIFFVTLWLVYMYFGIGDYVRTKSFDHEFDYPLNVDIVPLVKQMLRGEEPNVKPINKYPYIYVKQPKNFATNDKLDLVILVKSSINHFNYRSAIRKTWGQTDRFPNVAIRVVFFLGISNSVDSKIQAKVDDEAIRYNDIVQSDFVDNYFNNTIKTMMSFRYAYHYLPNSTFYLFSDDDMYISVLNLFKYLKDPLHYPKKVTTVSDITLGNRTVLEEPLFAGYVFKSAPHRHLSSKWRVSLTEYPYDRWPPYITAGAYVTSNEAMKTLYLGSLYVKHFRFDDIYLAIVAKKAGIRPRHCTEFYFYKKTYKIYNYKYVIASHGYGDQRDLYRVWNRQKRLGYA